MREDLKTVAAGEAASFAPTSHRMEGEHDQGVVDGELVPVLQIFHVTDLHVKDTTSNAIAVLSKKSRLLARFAQMVQRRNWFGWEEGTQGHLPRAPGAFEEFLRNWRADEKAWESVPTWLVDTGDRSAFGDPDSIAAGEKMLQAWSQALGRCPVRSLYGNHDMWPQTLPAYLPAKVRKHWESVRAQSGWDAPSWLTSPLSVPIPGHNATISLYALDTIAGGTALGAAKNTLAAGQLRNQDVLHFRMLLEGEAKRGGNGLRILAMHHPMAFPWLEKETSTGVLPTMKLLKEDRWASFLRNDGGIPENFGPWAHLLLSGHTHMSYPVAGLNGEVTSIAQGSLGPYQLQLVGSSLMLNRDSRARKIGPPVVDRRDVPGFEPSSVYPHPCQAQILRFYVSGDPGQPWIQMIRIPVYSDNAGRKYVAGDPDHVLLHYRLP